MRGASRWWVAAAALGFLGWASWGAMRVALADSALFEGGRRYHDWVAQKRSPSLDEWLAVRDLAAEATRITPGDPNAWELLGLVHLVRAGTVYADLALDPLREAALRRPTSGYTWTAIARAQVRLGRPVAEVEATIALAERFGPRELEVMAAVRRLRAELARVESTAKP